MSNYWLHRISYECDVSHDLLSKGWLSIGFSDLATKSGIQDDVKSKNDAHFDEICKAYGRNRWSLWNFLSFNQKDIVVVPLSGGQFSIYEIAGEPSPITELADFSDFSLENGEAIVRGADGLLCRKDENNKPVDLGFVVKVQPIKEHMPRSGYADGALTARMKIRQTNANINDLKESVQAVMRRTSPIDFYAAVIEEFAGKFLLLVKKELTPEKLELLIKWYFQKLGASQVYRPAKNESDKRGDADVIAIFAPLNVMFCVQANLHGGETSEWDADFRIQGSAQSRL